MNQDNLLRSFFGIQPLARLGQYNDPNVARDMRKQAIIQQITGEGAPAPTSVGQGAVQAANSILNGFALRQHNRGPFPDMPGGGKPRFLAGLANMFGGGRGGLY